MEGFGYSARNTFLSDTEESLETNQTRMMTSIVATIFSLRMLRGQLTHVINDYNHYMVPQRVTETTNTVKLTDRMWARLLASTNQPSFLNNPERLQGKVDEAILEEINNMRINSI